MQASDLAEYLWDVACILFAGTFVLLCVEERCET